MRMKLIYDGSAPTRDDLEDLVRLLRSGRVDTRNAAGQDAASVIEMVVGGNMRSDRPTVIAAPYDEDFWRRQVHRAAEHWHIEVKETI